MQFSFHNSDKEEALFCIKIILFIQFQRDQANKNCVVIVKLQEV